MKEEKDLRIHLFKDRAKNNLNFMNYKYNFNYLSLFGYYL